MEDTRSSPPEGNWLGRLRHRLKLENLDSWLRGDASHPAGWVALFRVSWVLWKGLSRNNLFAQAAALSYYTLIGLGPFLALGIMISGFLIQGEGAEKALVDRIGQALAFVAPPVAEWESAQAAGNGGTDPSSALSPEVVQVIDQIVRSARSGAVGVVGSLILIYIVIRLIIYVERAFNGVWGVQRGRSWGQRIISYWALASLGAVFLITAISVLSASTLIRRFNEWVPGVVYEDINFWAGPLLATLLLTLVLGAFNRFFPNTTVHWGPAFVGGVVGAILLFANHQLSFLYVHKVIREQSLYGSVGILPVFLFGLYLFWLILLFSCQVTYAVQSGRTLVHEDIWSRASPRTRESLALASFLMVARRFLRCERPPATTEIADELGVPAQFVNDSLARLRQGGWVQPLEPDPDDRKAEIRYQPGRPLDRVTLADFREAFQRYGDNSGEEALEKAEPLLATYRDALRMEGDLRRPLDECLRGAERPVPAAD